MRMVFVDDLKNGMLVAADVYALDNRYIPLIKAGTALTAFMISELKARGIRFVYIGKEIVSAFESMGRMPYVPPRGPVLSTKLREEAIVSLEEAFNAFSLDLDDLNESTKVIITHLDHVVSDLVSSLLAEDNTLVNINDLKSFDDYTFHHSLSVAVLSIAIAQRLGFSKRDLHLIGMCAIMHDIGKTAVPIHIIQKTARLDDNEFSIMKSHSPAGFDSLLKSGFGDDNVLQGVLHHHEKLDGSGYPDGIGGADIPIFSRIISIADVFDALTSSRPYRVPMQPNEAVEYIMGGAGMIFDFEIVNAFVQKVELYPVGSLVELSNGKIGVVLSNENQFRPVVRTADGEILDLNRDRKCLSIVIKKLFPNKNLLDF